MNRCFSEEELQALIEEIPADRLGQPEEVGLLALKLAESPLYLTEMCIRDRLHPIAEQHRNQPLHDPVVI